MSVEGGRLTCRVELGRVLSCKNRHDSKHVVAKNCHRMVDNFRFVIWKIGRNRI